MLLKFPFQEIWIGKKKPAEYFLFCLLLFMSLVRLWGLGAKPFSPDEIRAVAAAGRPIAEIFKMNLARLESLLLHPILGIHESEFTARLPACLAGIAGVWLLFFLTKNILGDKRVAYAASFLLAAHFLYFRYSQESRYYTELSVVILALMYNFYNLITKRRRIDKILFVAINAALFYLKEYAAIFFLAEAVVLTGLWVCKMLVPQNADRLPSKKDFVEYAIICALVVLACVPFFLKSRHAAIFGAYILAKMTGRLEAVSHVSNVVYAIPSIPHSFEWQRITQVGSNMFVSLWMAMGVLMVFTGGIALAIKHKKWFVVGAAGIAIVFYLWMHFLTKTFIPAFFYDEGAFERRLLCVTPLVFLVCAYGLANIPHQGKNFILGLLTAAFIVHQSLYVAGYVNATAPVGRFSYAVNFKLNFFDVKDIKNDILSYRQENVKAVGILYDYGAESVIRYYLQRATNQTVKILSRFPKEEIEGLVQKPDDLILVDCWPGGLARHDHALGHILWAMRVTKKEYARHCVYYFPNFFERIKKDGEYLRLFYTFFKVREASLYLSGKYRHSEVFLKTKLGYDKVLIEALTGKEGNLL